MKAKKKLIPMVIGILIAGLFAAFLLYRYAPTRETMSLKDYFTDAGDETCAVIFNGSYQAAEAGSGPNALIKDKMVYISLPYLKKNADDCYVYDSTEGVLRYATDRQLVTVLADSKTYTVDQENKTFDSNILIQEKGQVYLNLDWVKKYTDLTVRLEKSPNRLIIEQAGREKKTAKLRSSGKIRLRGGVKSKILAEAKKGDEVEVLEDYGGWSKVLSKNGVIGCIENRKLGKVENTKVKRSLPERNYQHTSFGAKIDLVWHQVTSQAANDRVASVLPAQSGINVISPTWYSLSDNQGNITDLSSASYVQTCHQNQVKVWALVSNLGENKVDSSQVLNTTSSRDRLINNLMQTALKSGVDGINVDFEALKSDAKDGYIEFIRELALKCRQNGLILSVDNYIPTTSSEFYQRKEQAAFADYLIMMAYDEHYNGSKEAGSVASISWVKDGIKKTLNDVPADQLVLGMPFYTRVWVQDENGKLTSSAMGMQDAWNYMQNNQAEIKWSEEDGQNYGSFQKDGKTYECWLEDEKSLELKLQVMQENQLAGGAFWKLGMEKSSVWELIRQYIK